jgi:hypothetical protein
MRAELPVCSPVTSDRWPRLRVSYPFHGSDDQRSLCVQLHSGGLVYYASGAWGYMEAARAQWRVEQQHQATFSRPLAYRPRAQPQR